ncbi:MAG: hypothetical protein R3B82_23550 [Sandaracinaceae bacterium]
MRRVWLLLVLLATGCPSLGAGATPESTVGALRRARDGAPRTPTA